MRQNTIEASDIPCHETFVDDYNYSSEWGNKLIDIWIKAKQKFRSEKLSVQAFRDELRAAVLNELDIEEAFLQGCASIGIEGDLDSKLFEQYAEIQDQEVMNLIPSGLHAELCWVPGWDEVDLDDLLYEFGLRSERCKSNYIEDVQPGKWLEVFLKMVNCNSVDLIAAAKARGPEGRFFAEKCAKADFKVSKDQNRPQLLTADQVITSIENAYYQALPMFHWEINVRSLFEMDPTRSMKLSTDKRGEVHVGFHEPVMNGGGYLDTYPGEVIIPPDATGFLGAARVRWNVNEVYGLYRPVFFVTPKQLPA